MNGFSGRSLFQERPNSFTSPTGCLSITSSLSSSPSHPCSPTSPSSFPYKPNSRIRTRVANNDNNAMKLVATKLNEMTQCFFFCGGSGPPRGGHGASLLDQVSQYEQATSLQDRHGLNSWTPMFSISEDESTTEEDGIEIDTELSLRPAYELYRV